MSGFEERLKHAVQRGRQRNEESRREAEQQALSEEELKLLHTKFRLKLSEHIERCLRSLPQHFPGFRYETVFGDRGWGAACYRNDLGPGPSGRSANFYSRLEVAIRPMGSMHVLELTAKGTIRDKEVFNRTQYQKLEEADPETFRELVDVWVLEYAELYAAKV